MADGRNVHVRHFFYLRCFVPKGALIYVQDMCILRQNPENLGSISRSLALRGKKSILLKRLTDLAKAGASIIHIQFGGMRRRFRSYSRDTN